MSDAVITFDRSGQIILTNPPAQSLLDIWKKLEWQERDLEEFGASVPEPLQSLFHTVMDRGEDVGDYIHVKKGSWSVQMAPLYTDNAIRGAVAVLRDITEEVKLEKMRSDFVANVSHEIRTPLSMMQGYSEALLDGMAGSPEESEELVQVIHDESLRMGRLVKDLLDLARMEAGHTDMHRQEVDVNELIERVHRKFTVRSKEQGLTLDYHEQGQRLLLPEADEDRLEQVLTNLLDNAFRHTPGGKKVTIAADRILGERHELIRIRIKDEGVGIASEDLPYIFDRFYKADKARVRGEDKGTGLGLAIVKNIVEAHGGSVSAASALGEGTEFTILLPISNKTKLGL